MSGSQNYSSRLQPLAGQDISTVEFDIDIRGWKVTNDIGIRIATIADLLYDVQSKRVRYVVLLIDGYDSSNRCVLAPVGVIHLAEPFVEIPTLSNALIDRLPDYIKDQVNPGVENLVRLAFAGSTDEQSHQLTGHPETIDRETFYDDKLFSTSHLFNFVRTTELTKTVNGVFDDGYEAESAITDLLAAGFSTDDVDLSSSRGSEATHREPIPTPDISNGGSVVSIKINTTSEAVRASEILNKNGSVSIFEHED